VAIRVAAPDAASAAYLMQATIGSFDAHLFARESGRWEVEIEEPADSHRVVVEVLDAISSWLREAPIAELTAETDVCSYVVRRDGWTRLRREAARR